MKKIMSIVIPAAVLVVLGILTASCPEVPAVLIDSLFRQGFRVSAFLFVVGAFVIETVVLSRLKKQGGITARSALIILAVSTAVGGAFLISDRNDKYDAPYMFTNTGEKCLVSAYTDVFESYPEEFDGTKMDEYIEVVTYIHETGGRIETFAPLVHFVIAMLIFAMGYMLLMTAFEGRRTLLSAFMAFPVGAAILCTLGMIFILLGIPFRRIAILAACAAIFAALSILIVKRRPKADSAETAKIFLIAGAGILLLIWGRSAWLSPDSIEKTMYGVMLAEYDLSRTEIFTFSAYGFIEPIIHCIAWKFGTDFLYSFYPIMAICALGIIAAMSHELLAGARRLPVILASGISIVFLATNYDFATLGIWVLSNGAIGTYLLMTASLILLAVSQKERITLPIIFVFIALLMTRVEGGVYIILFLALALGIKSFRRGYLHVCMIAAGLSAAWNLLQFAFYSGAFSQYWNPSNGAIVIAGAAALVIIALLSRLEVAPVRWIMRHYFVLSIAVFFIAAVVSVACTDKFGTKTLYAFIHHFASSDYNNSAALWSYLLLTLPVIITGKKKETALPLTIVLDYLLMTLVILCFRQDNVSHLAVGDSGRRVMAQIMPTAMLAVSLGLGGLSVFWDNDRLQDIS